MDYTLRKLILFTKVGIFCTTLSLLTHFVTHKPLSTKISAAEIEVDNELSYQPALSDLTNIAYPYEPIKPRDQRAISLEGFLRNKNSYLADYTDLIVELGDNYGIDYKLIVAISGAESGYCRVNFKPYNCWGYGQYGWSSPEESLNGYMELMNGGYFSKGLTTLETIAQKYNPTPDTYIQKVLVHYNSIP